MSNQFFIFTDPNLEPHFKVIVSRNIKLILKLDIFSDGGFGGFIIGNKGKFIFALLIIQQKIILKHSLFHFILYFSFLLYLL